MDLDHIKKLFNSSASQYDLLTNLFSVGKFNNDIAMDIIKNEISLNGLKVLDIGCGTGIWSSYFINSGALVHGIDFSEMMIKNAIKKYNNKMTFEVLSMFNINKFNENFFDIVTASYVIHEYNTEARIDLLKKIKKITKKWFIVHDYGGDIPFMPRLIESIEKSNYIDFINNFEKELMQIFSNCKRFNLKKGGTLYISSK